MRKSIFWLEEAVSPCVKERAFIETADARKKHT
jgi:hypothetical protein